MRAIYRVIASVLVLVAICGSGRAVGVKTFVQLSLDAKPSFDEPLSRWLEQMCDMAGITAGFYWDDTGKYLWAKLDMGKKTAFELRLIRRSGKVYLDSDLLKSPVVIDGVCDWADDMLTYAAFGLKTPSSGSETAVSAEGLALALKDFAGSLRAITSISRGTACRECENCGQCDNCRYCDASQALAMFVQALATRFDASGEHNALIIRCRKLSDEMQPFNIETDVLASDNTTVKLVNDAIGAVCRATADNA